MAGHSKWANIKHKKAATDAKRSKIWTRLIRELTIAAKLGGPDQTANPRLRLAMEKCAENNIPKDNIQKAIARGVGGDTTSNYEEIRYEAYAFKGIAIIIDCLTDNRIRTVAEVRHVLNKHGANLGAEGSCIFLFNYCSQFIFAPTQREEKLLELALESGCDDVIKHNDGSLELICQPSYFIKVKSCLELESFKAELAEITFKPINEIILDNADSQKIHALLDALENLDDVQEVYSNFSIENMED